MTLTRVALLALTVGLLLLAAFTWGEPTSASQLITQYRLDALEKDMAAVHDEHVRLSWLLVGAIASGLTNLVTYLFTREKPKHH